MFYYPLGRVNKTERELTKYSANSHASGYAWPSTNRGALNRVYATAFDFQKLRLSPPHPESLHHESPSDSIENPSDSGNEILTDTRSSTRPRTATADEQADAQFSEVLDSLLPIVVTDTSDRVLAASNSAAKLLGLSREEIKNRKITELIKRSAFDTATQPDNTTEPVDCKPSQNSIALSFSRSLPSGNLVWSLSVLDKSEHDSPRSLRENCATARTQRIASNAILRFDQPENSFAKSFRRERRQESSYLTRDEVLSSFEEAGFRSLIPRLTSLLGHLDLAVFSANATNLAKHLPPENRLIHALQTAKDESCRITKIIKEIRLLKRSVFPQKSWGNLRLLIEQCVHALDPELDAELVDLHCSHHPSVQEVGIHIDGVAVSQAVFWLIRKAVHSISSTDHRVFLQSSIADRTLYLSISYSHDPESMVESTTTRAAKTPASMEMSFESGGAYQPAEDARPSLSPTQATLTVKVPCIREA
jgi:hypothetical protein